MRSPCRFPLVYNIQLSDVLLYFLHIFHDRKKKSVSHIRFTNINLSQIDRQILSSFIVRLTAVILDLNYLSSDQTTSIFEKVGINSNITTSMFM